MTLGNKKSVRMAQRHQRVGAKFSYGLSEIWGEVDQLRAISGSTKLGQHLRQAFQGMLASPLASIVTLLTICVSLLLFAGFILIVQNLQEFLTRARTDLSMSVYLKDSAPQAQIEKMQAEIKALAGVEEVSFISKPQALTNFRSELGAESLLVQGLDQDNPLPASIEIRFSDNSTFESLLDQLNERYKGDPSVEYVQYSQGLVRELSLILRRFRLAGLIAVVLTLIMTGCIISNTIQLALYARREEIEIMKLVGATNSFIRAPFMIEGFLQGSLGGLVALLLLYAAFSGLGGFISQIPLFETIAVKPSFLSFLYMLLVIGSGVMVGVLGSYFAVSRFCRETEPAVPQASDEKPPQRPGKA